MRDLVTSSLELVGLTLVSAGFWLVSVPLGLIVGGLCLFAVGFKAAE